MNKLSIGIVAAMAAAAGLAVQPGKPITLNLGKGAVIQLISCPEGEFEMGLPRIKAKDQLGFFHKVKITRPFWLSKYKVSHEVWNAYKKIRLTDEDKALGGMKRVHFARWDEVEAFCEWLTRKFKAALPPGYVFRIPTDAEWEYAYGYRIGKAKPDDPHVRAMEVDFARNSEDMGRLWKEFSSIAVNSELAPKLKRAKLPVPEHYQQIHGGPVGTKAPNAFGFYDMVGNRGERVLDNIPSAKWGNAVFLFPGLASAIVYEPSETDPLRSSLEEADAFFLVRGPAIPSCARVRIKASTSAPFRVCIGPDLLTEKGLKKQ